MKLPLSTLLLSTTLAWAAPTRRAPQLTNTDVLQFLLSIEHTEGAFYAQGLKYFGARAFRKAGFQSWVFGRFKQLVKHENEHVVLLTQTLTDLGVSPPAPCTYNFAYHKDPKTFAATAAVFEGVGTSLYIRASSLLTNETEARMAASILGVEARQSSWLSSSVNRVNPWSSPEDTALTLRQVYTIASSFVVECPSSNPPPVVTAFPSLSASPANAPSGTEVTYTFNRTSSDTYYATYLYGLGATSVKLSSTSTAVVPPNLFGRYYVIITSAPYTTLDDTIDDYTTAGIVIVDAPFGAFASD